jgi:RNA polymerase sigma-70 factor, ECF subfamily
VAASGEEIERVYATRYTAFRRAVSAIVGDEGRAHDIVQEAFARALSRRKQFRGGSLEAWIWTIVVRETLDARGWPLMLVEHELPDELVSSESDPELAEAIRRLPPRRRLIVFLRYFADLPYDAIGELCGISTGTVAAALSQAHDELRKELELQGVNR